MGDNSSMDKQLNRFYHLEVSRMSGLRVRIMDVVVVVVIHSLENESCKSNQGRVTRHMMEPCCGQATNFW